MAKDKSILQEAIAQAKQVREAAINNAYKQLEEKLTPSIKAILEQKLEEDDDVDLNGDSIEESANSGFKEVKPPKSTVQEAEGDVDKKENDDKEEPEEEKPETEDEPKTGDKPKEEPEKANAAEGEPDNDDDDNTEGEIPDDEKIQNLTVGDLKSLITSIVSASQTVAPGGNEGIDETPGDVEGAGEEDTPLENSESPEDQTSEDPDSVKAKDDDDEEIDLKEMLRELENEGKTEKVEGNCKVDECNASKTKIANLERKNKLYESTIKSLKDTLSEVNLLNARLGCATRILGTKTLSESQKAKVVERFDNAKSVHEVRTIYKMFNESLSTGTSGIIKEHKEFASKATGVNPKANAIVDETKIRWQTLAGIRKD